jgi:hypothetical protein
MARNVLWPFVVIAGLSLANPSKAALGWTWDECQQHWGKPVSSKRLPDGNLTANFEAHDLLIVVWLTDDKVARVAYKATGNSLSETQLVTLQKANTISPTATWVFIGKDESTQNYEWELREVPDKTDWLATAIYAVKDNAFIVFTNADDQRARNANTQDASDL